MVEKSQFSLRSLTKRRDPSLVEIEALIDLLPYAALVVDPQSQHILAANGRAAELAGFSRQDLAEVTLKGLFKDWDAAVLKDRALLDRAISEQPVVELLKRNGLRVDVQLSFIILPPQGKRVLVGLEAVSFHEWTETESQRTQLFLDNLQQLARISHQFSGKASLGQALKIGSALTGASILAVYLAGEQAPELQLSATWGPSHLLPQLLPGQDLVHLRASSLWKMGKRTTCSLHRAVRAKQGSYLASAPLGQAKATIGVVVAADPVNAPPEYVLPILEILAATITSLLQQEAMGSLISEQEHDAALDDSIEEAVQEGLLVLAPDLKTIKLNPAAEMILGYASQEVRGQPIENILIGTETLLPALLAAQDGSASLNLGNVRLYRRSGEAFLALVRTLPVMHAGVLEGIIILLQDLSEREQTREHTQQLEQRAILGEVTAIFAHEVRNPINNISTGLQLMSYNLPETDPNQELISRLTQDCDRLTELMKSVLSFARPTDYDMERLDLSLLLQRLIERLRPRITRVNVQYELQLEPDLLIQGNLRALEQVFNNLINNAVQAMSEDGGRLVLKAQRSQIPTGRQEVEVSVADTGPGIPKEIQERIFQPFFTTNRNGTGLGLAITKRIITAHKGTIRVNSFPGGTVFHVQFPLDYEATTE